MAAATVFLLAAPLSARGDQSGSRWLQVEARASALFASFDGELQTPLGGRAGTTSHERPTTEEVGLDGLRGFASAHLAVRVFEQHSFRFGYTALTQSGHETLARSLITHGQTFPKGARVESRLELPFGRVGYRAEWLPLDLGPVRITPEAGVARLDFAYRLRASEATGEADRAYVIYYAYWGAAIDAALGSGVRGELDVFASAGLNNVTSIDTDLRLLLPVFERTWLRADLVVGWRGIWLHYKDDQHERQNDIDVRVGGFSTRPWAGAQLGVQLGF